VEVNVSEGKGGDRGINNTYKHSVASNFEVDDYRRKQTKKAGPFLILPFGF